MNRRSKAIARIAAIVLLAPGATIGVDTAKEQWRNSVLWTHVTGGEEIGHFEVTPLGSLFVSTDGRVAALGADTGDVIWEREDISRCRTNSEDSTVRCEFLDGGNARFSAIANTRLGLFQVGFRGWENPYGRAVVVDLATGTTIWDSADFSFAKVRALLYVQKVNQFMLSGETDGMRSVLAAVSGSDGGLLWQRDIDFPDGFKFIGAPDDARVLAYGKTDGGRRTLVSMSLRDDAEHWRLEGFLRNDARNRNALVLRDTDETAILYVTKDGPFRVRLDSGDVLWRVGLWDKDPPDFAPMVLDGGLLFVPNGKAIDALHAGDGSRAWRTAKQFRAEPVDLRILPRGLLVRARSFDLLDPKTGRSLWAERTGKFLEGSPAHVDEDAAYVAEVKWFSRVDLATGGVKRLAKYNLHGDVPARVEETDKSLVVMSRQNLLGINRVGEIPYHVYLKAPGASVWMKALAITSAAAAGAATESLAGMTGPVTFSVYMDPSSAMSVRYGATAETPANYFMYTEEPFEGRKGFSLVRVAKASGAETGRLWLDKRSPKYEIDRLTETVYFRNADHELSALRFASDSAD